MFVVGEPGIEPGPHGPKPRTLPLCYTPSEKIDGRLLTSKLRTRSGSLLTLSQL